MPIKMYKRFVDQEINNMMGKNLSILQIRKHLSKAYFGGKEPLDETSPIFSSPRWNQILHFIGLEKRTHTNTITIDYTRFPTSVWDFVRSEKDSPLLQLADIILKTSGNRGYKEASLYDLHFRNRSILINFSEYSEKISSGASSGTLWIRIGDSVEKSKEVETIAAKEFIKFKGYVSSNSWSSSLSQSVWKKLSGDPDLHGILVNYNEKEGDIILFSKSFKGDYKKICEDFLEKTKKGLLYRGDSENFQIRDIEIDPEIHKKMSSN
jgi:hypothetical protein